MRTVKITVIILFIGLAFVFIPFGRSSEGAWGMQSIKLWARRKIRSLRVYLQSVPEFVRMWGGEGSGNGRFNEPYDIAVDSKGFVYVTDARNQRVEKFTHDGRFVTAWGRKGKGVGEFEKPVGIAVDGKGFIYVSDYENDTIQKFDSSGRFILKWGSHGTGDGEFDAPNDIAADDYGNIYIVDFYNHRVQVFDGSGQFLRAWGRKGKVNNIRSVLSPLFPDQLRGEFYYPAKITAGNGMVYLSDSYNNRVQVFTAGGKYLFQWGGMGFWRGRFRVTSGIDVGPRGRVYVADFYNNRVQVFNKEGAFLYSFGGKGEGPGMFDGPVGVAVGDRGNIYIVDWANDRVQIFRLHKNGE